MFWAAVLEHAQIHTLTEMGEEVDGWREGRREGGREREIEGRRDFHRCVLLHSIFLHSNKCARM